MTEPEKKVEAEKHDESSSSSDENEHVHDENCQHDHGDAKKGNRGEKKFKKAMGKMGLKPVSGINRVTIKKGKAVIIHLFSSLLALMTQMYGNHLELKALMLSSVNQILTEWELDKTKSISSQIQLILKELLPLKPKEKLKERLKLQKSKRLQHKTYLNKVLALKISRWSWNMVNVQKLKQLKFLEKQTTIQLMLF